MASTFPLEIVTPDKKFFEEEVEMLTVSGIEGELGILKNHIPLVTPLAIGKVRIKLKDGTSRTAAVAEGYLDVQKDKTTIVTDAAEWPDEIDVKRAELAKKRAEERIKQKQDNVDYTRAEVALKKAINRIQISKIR